MVRRIGVREGRVSGMEITSSAFLTIARSDGRSKGNDLSFPCPDLFDIGDHFLVDIVPGGQDDDRHLPVDQGDGAVLHLTSRIAFRMDIRDLLQFQRPFQGDGVVDPSPEIEKIPGMEVLSGDLALLDRRPSASLP